MLQISGAPALSAFRIAKLLDRDGRVCWPEHVE